MPILVPVLTKSFPYSYDDFGHHFHSSYLKTNHSLIERCFIILYIPHILKDTRGLIRPGYNYFPCLKCSGLHRVCTE